MRLSSSSAPWAEFSHGRNASCILHVVKINIAVVSSLLDWHVGAKTWGSSIPPRDLQKSTRPLSFFQHLETVNTGVCPPSVPFGIASSDMDPFSVATGAVALMGICASVAHGIKMFIEKAKTSKSTLIKLLEKIEHVRLYLAQLRSIAARLTDPEHKSILVPFDQDACEKTMSKLRALVNKICGAADTGTIKVTIAWTQNKSVAEDLVIELEAQQTHMSHALLALTA